MKDIKLNPNIGMKQVIFCSASPVDSFYRTQVLCKGSTKVFANCYSNPLHILLNQKRLDQIGSTGLEEWLNQFKLRVSQMDELRKHCSDEDILKTLKSRHLQSPAEILAWNRYMSQNLDKFNSEVQALLAEEMKKTEQSNEPTQEDNV